MAKATGKKLKVFQTQLGFYESVVAAASKAAALRAWGVRRDLFAQGLAGPATDDAAITAALANPDTPLKRAAGSSDAFSIDPGRPRVSDIDPGESDALPSRKAKTPEPKRKPPDRSRLDAALTSLETKSRAHEDEISRLQTEIERIEAEEDALRRQKAELTAERAAVRENWRAERADLEKAVARERRDFRLAGGKD